LVVKESFLASAVSKPEGSELVMLMKSDTQHTQTITLILENTTLGIILPSFSCFDLECAKLQLLKFKRIP